jgi:7-cyano-7-deazaguanine synthase
MTQIERKAFCLLSGGIDSTTCLHKAIFDFSEDTHEDTVKRIDFNQDCYIARHPNDPIPWVEAISVNYGQRHIKEAEYARMTCEMLGIKHHVLNLSNLLKGGNTMLTNPDIEIPNVDYANLPHGVSPTYVPFRNGTLLSVITAYAQKWINASPDTRQAGVYFGAHSEDAANWAYPDCTPEFIGSMANAIHVGTYFKVRLYTPLQWLVKHEIITLGESLGVNWYSTWSCYAGNEIHCGTCPTCRSRRQGFIAADVPDPTVYANPLELLRA